MIKGNFVLDLDGAFAIAASYQAEETEKEVKAQLGEAYFAKHCLTAYKYPHYIFPGTYALLKWLHQQGGKIFFFSSGIKERNVELTAKMMKMAFGEEIVKYKVFSREHCVDTTLFHHDEAKEKLYQTFFYGQRKKKLGGIVVPETQMTKTLLIDDDNSYMVKGEEYNFVLLRYTHEYLQERDSRWSPASHSFHKSYYLAGLFSKIFEVMKERKLNLRDAAKYVQIDSQGAELSRDFYYPTIKQAEFYIKGLEILQKIDPTLKFYYPVEHEKDEKEG
jgi:hypothetical protein